MLGNNQTSRMDRFLFNYTMKVECPCFPFNGKEKDFESGFHYYGARYYESELLTGWLGVDPMMDKYPSISPYAYCAWNPVKLVDPDGRDVWSLSDDGTMTWVRASRHDVIKYNRKEITLQNSPNVFGTGVTCYSFSLKDRQYYTFTDVMDAQKVFEFFADNLDYEFSALGYVEGGKRKYDLSTSLSSEGDAKGSSRAVELGDKMHKHFHNHPDDVITPSSPVNRRGVGDDKTFSEQIKQTATSCEFFLYTKDYGGNYINYKSEGGKIVTTVERESSFIKNSTYSRKPGSVKNAFGF